MAADSTQFLMIIILTLCLSLQEVFGHPLSEHAEQSGQPSPRLIRTKRCSCNNQMDSECHYFCHLDIIWVNTPSKTTVYGLGSPLSRRRRSANRCACANPSDRTCVSFCYNSFQHALPMQFSPSTDTQGSISGRASSNLLASLRNVVKDNMLAVRQGASPRKKSLRVWNR